ncbi:MAG: hypothetical protein IJ424_03315 [Oscillospiraceae bacterium]|nr:hypothetical protein [Oscillospiraceae bacterium]
MRSYDEFEQLIYSGGDLLFSCIFAKTNSREETVEIICSAAEKYLENRKKLKNQNGRYRLLAEYCERILEEPLQGDYDNEHLSDNEREIILASAKLYIASGGKFKKLKSTLIFIAVVIVVAVLLFIWALSFFYSDEFRSGVAGMDIQL